MIKHTLPAVVFSLALALGLSTSAKAGDIITLTVSEFNGAPDFDPTPADYPLPSVLIGDFTFTLPAGSTVYGATISGFFGNNDVSPITAASDYFIDNGAIAVAQCDDPFTGNAPCDATASSPTPWSYTFSPTDLSNLNSSAELAAGSIDFTVVQNFAIAVQTDTTTLTLDLAPEPASIFVFCGGLAGIALLRRFRRA